MSAPLEFLARYGVEVALALTLVLALGALAAARSRSPVRRHRLVEWTLGLALLAVPLLILPLPRLRSSATPRAEAPAVFEPTWSAPFVSKVAYTVTSEPGLSSPTPATTSPPALPSRGSEILREETSLAGVAPSTSTARWWSLGFLLGAAGFALHLAISLWCLRRLARRALPAPDWVLELMPGSDRPRILVSNETERPFCFGLGRGTILLPATLIGRHQRRRLRVVLLHEGAHLEQRHGRTRLVAALAAPFFYWQPLYWWLVRVSRRDAELVADELASGAIDKRTYAAELLGLVESTDRVSLAAATGLGAFGSRRNFLDRMETLLMRRTPLIVRESRLQFAGRATVALTLLATVTMAWGPTPPAQEGPEGELAEGSSVPLLSEIPLIADRFQEQDDPVEGEAVPHRGELPVIGFFFGGEDDPGVDQEADTSPPAGTFDLEFNFGRLEDLLELQQRCATERGQLVITALTKPTPGSEAIEGSCRVFDLTVDGKNRFLRRPAASEATLPEQHSRVQLFSFSVATRTGTRGTLLIDDASPEVDVIRTEIRNLERRLVQLECEKADVEAALQAKRIERDRLLGVEYRDRAKPLADPAIQGVVLNVADAGSGQLVAINRGSRQGVKVGTTFEIYRESTYKGRIEVIQVQDDICVGKVVLGARPMSMGDRATTKL